MTWAGFGSEAVSFTQGADRVRWYRSSPPAERGFCRDCGSSLFFRSERWPGELHIALGVMDAPIDRRPQGHVFADNRVDWVAIDEALDLHPEVG